ncbi:MAG: Ig-like domain-containing protein [Gemmatimonadetes bacterium]|nr:Ig-like domain-containing protein [Gemmatimonadota bacterium]
MIPHFRLPTLWSDRRLVANGVVLAALPALVAAILACGEGAAPPQSPNGVADITIVPASALLTLGETRQFTATPRTATGDTTASVGITWSSSAPNVASVSAVGRVTATAVGEATIVASAGGISRGSRLRVEPPQVVDLVIAPDSAVIEAGDSRRFVATPRFAPGATEVPITSTWQSSAPAVAAVSSTGLVSAVSAGVALISAAYGDVRSTRAMRVVPPIIEQLALCWPMLQRGLSTPTATSCSDSLTLPPAWNAPVMLASPAKPWAEISPTAVRFEVADPTVVTFVAVDSLDYLPKGWVARALRPGTTTYTATVGTVSLRGRLTVRPLPARLTVASSDWVGGGSPRIESWGWMAPRSAPGPRRSPDRHSVEPPTHERGARVVPRWEHVALFRAARGMSRSCRLAAACRADSSCRRRSSRRRGIAMERSSTRTREGRCDACRRTASPPTTRTPMSPSRRTSFVPRRTSDSPSGARWRIRSIRTPRTSSVCRTPHAE